MGSRLWAGRTDLGTVPPVAARKPHGLRSESAPDGYYAGPVTPARPRPSRPKSGPVTSNRRTVDPAVARELANLARIEAEEIAREQALEERQQAWRRANVIGNID